MVCFHDDDFIKNPYKCVLMFPEQMPSEIWIWRHSADGRKPVGAVPERPKLGRPPGRLERPLSALFYGWCVVQCVYSKKEQQRESVQSLKPPPSFFFPQQPGMGQGGRRPPNFWYTEKKCSFDKCTIKVRVSCSRRCPEASLPSAAHLMVSLITLPFFLTGTPSWQVPRLNAGIVINKD